MITSSGHVFRVKREAAQPEQLFFGSAAAVAGDLPSCFGTIASLLTGTYIGKSSDNLARLCIRRRVSGRDQPRNSDPQASPTVVDPPASPFTGMLVPHTHLGKVSRVLLARFGRAKYTSPRRGAIQQLHTQPVKFETV